MKQSELDRSVRNYSKAAAKARGWKSVGGLVYWSIGPLLFVLNPVARMKERSFHSSLAFKWRELDLALWDILGMPENANEPFSLHANGAFTLGGREILACTLADVEWAPGRMELEVDRAFDDAGLRAQDIAGRIDSLDSYLALLETDQAAYLLRYPLASIHVWQETLLAAWRRNDMRTVEEISRARIAANDSGGFRSNGMSFYENALHLSTRKSPGQH